jgi:MFS family permease
MGREPSGRNEQMAGVPAGRAVIVTAMGLAQILAWGSSYYLTGVLALPIARDTGWPLAWVVGGLSLGLLMAGCSSPIVGRAINLKGGRPVMAMGAVLLGLGLLGLGLAQHLPVYIASWLVIGLGMGAGLYDAAFSTLGRLYGRDGRGSIAAITLFGGFASTVCWPLSAFLLDQLGWRGACLVYAAIQLGFSLPLYLLVLPRLPPLPIQEEATATGPVQRKRLIAPEHRRRFLLLSTATALASLISTTVAVHLLTLLQAAGLTLAAAVALGAVVGPSQVSARALDMLLGRHYHPIWTKLAATVLVTAGISLLLFGFPVTAIALMLYGSGVGIDSIARGTLPLALFDPKIYAAIMGAIAMPSLIAQAASPSLGALLLDHGGPGLVLSVLAGLAVANIVLVALLWLNCRWNERA